MLLTSFLFSLNFETDKNYKKRNILANSLEGKKKFRIYIPIYI